MSSPTSGFSHVGTETFQGTLIVDILKIGTQCSCQNCMCFQLSDASVLSKFGAISTRPGPTFQKQVQ